MRRIYLFAAVLLSITSLSPNFPPTEAYGRNSVTRSPVSTTVSVTGKVKTPDGRGIKGAFIVIRDANSNAVVRSTYSSSFGYYRLEQIETGRSYVLSISHRRYLFALPAQLLDINAPLSGVDFTGEPSEE